MAFNLVELIKDQLGDEVIGAISNSLGSEADAGKTNTAVGGAVPGILKGLLASASTDSGAQSIFNTAKEQDDSILDNLGSVLGGDNSSMISAGTRALGGLLGDNALSKLAGAVAGFAGMNKDSGSSLLGMLAPVIFSVVKRKIMSENLDVSGFASMLKGQKDNIEQAMPQELTDMLNAPETTPEPAVAATTTDVPPPAAATPKPADVAPRAAQEEEKSGSIWSKLLPILALLILGWLAFQMFSGSDDEVAEAPAVEMPEAALPGGMNVGEQISNVIGSATDTLSKITDVESAQEALPDIEALNSRLENATSMLDKVPESARESVSAAARNGLGQIQPMIDKVLEIPGVGPILRPAVETMMEKLAIISG